jgi:hypothetical protein
MGITEVENFCGWLTWKGEEEPYFHYTNIRCFFSVLIPVIPPEPANAKVIRPLGRMLGGNPTGYCNRGHEFTPENSYTNNRGKRRCRTCYLMKQNERRKVRRG